MHRPLGEQLLATLSIVVSIAACKKSEPADPIRDLLAQEMPKLERELAAHNEAEVLASCMITDGAESAKHMSSAVAAKIARLCNIEAPRMFLDKAIETVKAEDAKGPELHDLSCMQFQLYASRALETIAKHPTNDPQLKRLADDYRQLCPKTPTAP